MYYPESAIIASNNSHRTDVIQQVDKFLFERQGKPFYAGTAADTLHIKLADFQGILNLYKAEKVITERKVWLCPKDREEIDPVRDDVFHCPTCGRNYREDQCEWAVLYTAQRIEGKDETLAPESISSETENTEDTIKPQPKGHKLTVPRLPKLNEPWAIIIAAIITGACAIIAVLVANSLQSNNNPATQPSSIVTFTETVTPPPMITAVPSETVNTNAFTITQTVSLDVTQTRDSATISVEVTPSAVTNCFARVNADENIPIYNAPDTQGQLVARFTEGQTEVLYLSQDREWLQINYDTGGYGGNAWVQAQSDVELIGNCDNLPVFGE